MRILVVNKFWYGRGGLEQVMFNEIRWLEGAGHVIAHFSTAHPANEPSPWSDYFVPYIELGPHGDLPPAQKALGAARLFYNPEAARRFAAVLRAFRPDVVHFHGIHRQLSPSIMITARRHGMAAVQTFHDHQAVCPADVLLLGGVQPCSPPLCSRANPLPCVTHRCLRGSRVASALSATEYAWRYDVLRYASLIDVAIAPSRCLSTTMTSGGWHETPVRVLPNAAEPAQASRLGDDFLYAGRLSLEKGVQTLLDAAESASARVVIAGDGPLRAPLEDAATARRVPAQFAGRVESEEVRRLISACRAVVVPSICVENAPLVILEAMAAARPVIASRVGGIPEQVRDGVDGLLVPPGDAVSLAAAMRRLKSDPRLAQMMGEAGCARASKSFSPESHLRGLVEIYGEAIRRRSAHRSTANRRAQAVARARLTPRGRRSAL
jgi:glycosyltransferase involved in cell wall biosynthesis